MTYRERRLAEDDIHCLNQEKADIRFQDGGLPHVMGACSYQVVRASKDPELSPEGRGFTYNHAGMLAYHQGHFLYEYLAGPRGEHEAPSAVFLTRSKDGIHWEKPVEAFPAVEVNAGPYCGPKKECITTDTIPCIVHQRMGFYTSGKGKAGESRLLMMTFYGISPDFHTVPNNGYGVGRAVREIYRDFTMSPIYMLRYNLPGGYNRENTELFPYYEESKDEGLIAACKELLADRLVTQQWWEEERLDTEFFTRPGGRALSYYTLPAGRVMGVFKDSLTSYSDDGGEHWSEMKKSASIETSSGKVWGQKTPDGRYALLYNPSSDSAHRWPLAVVTGDNGVDFDHLAAVTPEVSPCRYEGQLKNLGPQYMRGITEANEQPDDMAFWVVYSVNKEDMWISRIPVPVVCQAEEDVDDHMDCMTEEDLRSCWNLYVPSWNQAGFVTGPDGVRGFLISDCDPYNRTRAERMFLPGCLVQVKIRFRIDSIGKEPVGLVLQDGHGKDVTCVTARPDGYLYLHYAGYDNRLCGYRPGEVIDLAIEADCVENRVEIQACCGQEEGRKHDYASASVHQVERIVFMTKYNLPFQGLEDNGKLGNLGNLPGADVKQDVTELTILELRTKSEN